MRDPKERKRRELADVELLMTLARYDEECGDVKVYHQDENGNLVLKEIIPNPYRKDEKLSQT